MINRSASIRVFGAIAALAMLTSCATPARRDAFGVSDNASPSTVATLYKHSEFRRGWGILLVQILLPVPHKLLHQTEVTQIDNRALLRMPGSGSGFVVWPEELRIGAGERVVKFHYRRDRILDMCGIGVFGEGCVGYFDKDTSITFTAEGEHAYRVFAYMPDEKEWTWVEDITTGHVVAGEKPPAEQ